MPPFDDWNVIDDEEEEELQDTSVSLHDLVCFTEYPLFRSSLKENEM